MRKKLVALSMAALMLAALVIGGTLAYFTDTDDESNTFTVGKVDIQLNEYDDDEGTQDFTFDQALLPSNGTDGNVITKAVFVENIGDNDAYCWIEVWIPTAYADVLHYVEGTGVTKQYLGEKDEKVGYALYISSDDAVEPGNEGNELLASVYLDAKVDQTVENDQVTGWTWTDSDGKSHTVDSDTEWHVDVVAIGYQADGVASIDTAIGNYYSANADDAA
jgi:predicted ribosomally synthesized peptide with SipW-like signal peptide